MFTAERAQLEEIEAFVRSGRYASASAFFREAIREKLLRLRRERLEQQVADYCDERDLRDGEELVRAQAFEEDA